MQTFLSKVVSEVSRGAPSLSETTFVLPNKRAGLFLKTILKEQLEQPSFLPKVLSIEDFVKQVSGFEILDSVHLLFEFYEVYKKHTPKEKRDTFDHFAKWAPLLLQDFSELDSNLSDAPSILSYLSDVKRLEQWQPDLASKSQLASEYLLFFERIMTYYKAFDSHLRHMRAGYQGMVYKVASEGITEYLQKHGKKQYVFASFNALTKSEELILQELLNTGRAQVFWDNDVFYEQSNNQSGQFFKKYEKTWPHYRNHAFKWKEENINTPKTIHFHGLPKNISQIKHVGTLLDQLRKSGGIEDTAVILGNEKLLPSLLNSIPKEISKANITMGYDLQNVPMNTFFSSLFNLHLNKAKWNKKHSFYYKDLVAVLNDPVFQSQWISHKEVEKDLRIILYQEKTIFVSEKQLMELVSKHDHLSFLFGKVFTGWNEGISQVIDKVISIIQILRESDDLNHLEREYLFKYFNIFIQLSNFNKQYGFIEDLGTLYQVFLQILKNEKLSFQGEPLEGLQIMGLLESRGLDFRNVIITSVNEGFLPVSGSNNSFIPLDIKLENKMPTFFEKDAVFSYHFFRLMHRAENVYLIYNNIADDFGAGEPSRFIRQLEVARKLGLLPRVDFDKKVFNPKLTMDPLTLRTIKKSNAVLHKLKELSVTGLSPTALINYIRNPLDFYKRNVLGIKEFREVEETIAPYTFGTIVHDSLEQLYSPYLNRFLEVEHVEQMIRLSAEEVERQFKNSYSPGSFQTGKNYLAFEIAKQFVLNFLRFEIREIKAGMKVKILGLEVPLEMNHYVAELGETIKIKGKIDRIDLVDGVVRISDYKTGKVNSNQLRVKDWELITKEEKYSKSFQVLTYALMYLAHSKQNLEEGSLSSGIISLKNLNEGFMPFNGGELTPEILSSFITELDRLILEIFDEKIPFQEKELPTYNY